MATVRRPRTIVSTALALATIASLFTLLDFATSAYLLAVLNLLVNNPARIRGGAAQAVHPGRAQRHRDGVR